MVIQVKILGVNIRALILSGLKTVCGFSEKNKKCYNVYEYIIDTSF